MLRLFFASALSFVLRWGYFLLFSLSCFRFFKSELFAYSVKKWGEIPSWSIGVFLSLISLFFMLLTTSAIKCGEEFIYFTRAEGGSGRLPNLFKFIGFKNALRSLGIKLSINIFRFGWLVYFLLPASLCLLGLFYIHKNGNISSTVAITLLTGFALLFAVSIVMWRTATLRYNGASYYMWLQNMPIKKAIRKSIRYTDGVLSEGVILEYTLTGWYLLCFFLVPLIYCVPYIKLSKATFISHAVSRRVSSKQRYAVCFLPFSGKHINQGS